MPDLNCVLSPTMHLPGLDFVAAPLAYVGMGPGPEFIPYFMALLGVVGAAAIAILQWPVLTLLRWLKGSRGRAADAETSISADSSAATEVGCEQLQ